MRNFFLVVVCLLSIQSVYAGGDNFTAGARAAAMGDASVTLSDVFSTTTNQAGLAFMQEVAFGIYADRKFLSATINNFNAAAAVPFSPKIGAFGLSVNYYGNNLYNEIKAGLAYARKFGDKFSAGLQFDYLRFFISEHGEKNIFTLEAGFQYKPWKVLTIGAHIYNPVPYKIDKVFNERLPTVVKLGVGYEPSSKVLIAAEYQQDIYYKPQIKGGVEYRPVKYLHLRAGMQTTPFSFSFGLGALFKGVRLDAGSAFHPVLGFTPQLSIQYGFIVRQRNSASQP
ncbi:MAG: hypothetical protein RMJ53_09075 [Chitinophagales bacterium]|nr:hypothetical protein [Chitinophagales bacterium]MDW8274365.1 hypothetical protein [Chitinophagales bacterium]